MFFSNGERISQFALEASCVVASVVLLDFWHAWFTFT